VLPLGFDLINKFYLCVFPLGFLGTGTGTGSRIFKSVGGTGTGTGTVPVPRNVAILQRFEIETLQDPIYQGGGDRGGTGTGTGTTGTQRSISFRELVPGT